MTKTTTGLRRLVMLAQADNERLRKEKKRLERELKQNRRDLVIHRKLLVRALDYTDEVSGVESFRLSECIRQTLGVDQHFNWRKDRSGWSFQN